MLRKTQITFFLVILFSVLCAQAQQKKAVTLEDIWQKGTFQVKNVTDINWMKDGKHYTSLVVANNATEIIKYDINSGNPIETIASSKNLKFEGKSIEFEEYEFNSKEDKILLQTDVDPIYRRSSKGYYYIYDVKSKQVQKLSQGGKQSYATVSPDGNYIAFVRDNNLFLVSLNNMSEKALTTDGKFNEIINGSTDWVYEEEFSFAKAFFWSPDSKKIAFYTFNESQVKQYDMQMWGALYPQNYTFKYPKAGEANSKVKISVYNLDNKDIKVLDTGKEEDIYIPRVSWTNDATILSIRKMNRLQNQLEILHANVTTGQSSTILQEKNTTYVDIDFADELIYLKNTKEFLYTSEQDGFKHVYLYDNQGKLIRQITKGAWEASQLLGIDEENNLLYYTSTEDSPLERHLYAIDIKGKNKKKLTSTRGTHEINFNPNLTTYLDYHTSANMPLTVSLHQASGKQLKVIEENKSLKTRLENYQITPKEFFNFKTSENIQLNGWMIKPTNFDASKKYPVLMFVYGGPNHQNVKDNWEGPNYFWFQHLASKGYIIVSVDNRGTGARGADFKKSTYAQLGKLETKDQIETAKYLGNLSYIDNKRIGIWGWSFGGYMTSLCMTIGADYFKAGIAVAPVTSWRFYDTIYTERYLKRPQDNPEGYDENSPLQHASKLKGKYLIIHGTGDDNVHFQNTVAFQDELIKSNKQFESFFYPNRNHSIYGGYTRLHLYTMMTNFIEKNL